MPRYFFHIHHGRTEIDEVGTDLPDVEAAEREAVRLAGAVLLEEADKIRRDGKLSLEVNDEADRLLFTLHCTASRAP